MNSPVRFAPLSKGTLCQDAVRGLSALAVPFTEEDLPLLEAQQLSIGDDDFWSLKLVLLPGDAAAIRARRVLDGLIAQEKEDGL